MIAFLRHSMCAYNHTYFPSEWRSHRIAVAHNGLFSSPGNMGGARPSSPWCLEVTASPSQPSNVAPQSSPANNYHPAPLMPTSHAHSCPVSLSPHLTERGHEDTALQSLGGRPPCIRGSRLRRHFCGCCVIPSWAFIKPQMSAWVLLVVVDSVSQYRNSGIMAGSEATP